MLFAPNRCGAGPGGAGGSGNIDVEPAGIDCGRPPRGGKVERNAGRFDGLRLHGNDDVDVSPRVRKPPDPGQTARRSDLARAVLLRMPMMLFGLTVVGCGIALNIRSNMGLSPWDVFHQGVALRTSLSFGAVTIIVGAVVFLGWIPLRTRVGPGTLFNPVVVGLVIDRVMLLVDDASAVPLRYAYLLGGVLLVGIGSGLYIGARLGPGPRDGLMTGLAEKGLSIRSARFAIEGVMLVAGWLLGGAVGLGTLLFTVMIGPLVQFFLRLFDRGPIEGAGAVRWHRGSAARQADRSSRRGL